MRIRSRFTTRRFGNLPVTSVGLQFDGVDDYGQTVDCPIRLQLPDAYTLSVWIKPDDTQKGGAGILSKTDASGADNHWALQFHAGGNRLLVCHPGGVWDTDITLGQVAGAWHHIVIVRSSSGIASYLDPSGSAPVPQKTESWTTPPATEAGTLTWEPTGPPRPRPSTAVFWTTCAFIAGPWRWAKCLRR